MKQTVITIVKDVVSGTKQTANMLLNMRVSGKMKTQNTSASTAKRIQKDIGCITTIVRPA